jgi:hypothetical protein
MTNPPGPTGPQGPSADDGEQGNDPGWTDPWASPSQPTQPVPQPQQEQPAAPQPPQQPGGWYGEAAPGYGQQSPYGQQPAYGQQQPAYPLQPGYGYGQPGYPPGAYGYARPTNGKATAALWSGVGLLVTSLCCGLGVLGVIPIVLGVKARNEIRATGGQQGGDGMALAGIITGAIAVLLGLVALVVIAVALAHGDWSTSTSAGYSEGL